MKTTIRTANIIKIKTFVIALKVFIAILSIIVSGPLQAAILHPELYNVYLGKSIAVWSICAYIIYNALVRISLLLIGLYRK